ncbi:site-specific integrase [Pantoea anthophila]|uniref:Core-binding (CB) domain-containing protein n=1 Tax=Pantoea anthophila TaxID=470931 RepID=A0ABY2Z579_9GAMM|nr:site-specific integrase [Pantoea anthophila]TPV23668.1 hypothetical protein FJW00_15060 [Pantoea anthophila]
MITSPLCTYAILLSERWLKVLSDLGRSRATVTAYRAALTHYFSFCSRHELAPEKAIFEDIAVYIRPQLPGMPQSAASATLQLRLSAIRLWFDYLIYMDVISLNPLPRSGSPGMPSAARRDNGARSGTHLPFFHPQEFRCGTGAYGTRA